jgi:hypothetical protein
MRRPKRQVACWVERNQATEMTKMPTSDQSQNTSRNYKSEKYFIEELRISLMSTSEYLCRSHST